jgi:hypothetical protein
MSSSSPGRTAGEDPGNPSRNIGAPLETPPILGGRLDKNAIWFFIVVETQQSRYEEPDE